MPQGPEYGGIWDFNTYEFGAWLATVRGWLTPDFSVGRWYPPVDWTPAIIPELVSGTSVAETLGVPTQIDRRDTPSDQGELLLVIDANGEQVDTSSPFYVEGISQAGIRYMESQTPTTSPVVGSDSQEEGMGWYTDLDEALGGWLPGGAPNTTGMPTWGDIGAWPTQGFDESPNGAPPNGGGPSPGPSAPPAMAGGCPIEDPYKGCVYKRVCGQWRWVKQKRRRRKQLFTPRDAAQMSSLMGSLPAGAPGVQIAKTWIASHPS